MEQPRASKKQEIPTQQTTLTGHTGTVYCLSFHPLLDILASGSEDGKIKLWDVETEECLVTMRGHLQGVQGLVWSSDGKVLG